MTSRTRQRSTLLAISWALAGVSLAGCTSEPHLDPEPNAQPPNEESPAVATPGVLTGSAPRAMGGFASVVLLEPGIDSETPIPSQPAVMDQYNTDFHPRMLIVRVGQKVQFKNSEDTLHNVHVINTVTRETAFNVATPVTGSYDYVFESAGVFDVSCGVHPSMAAIIVATQTPYAVIAELDGAFSMPRPPAGEYTVTVWNLDASRRSEHRVAIDDTTAVLNLDGGSEES